MRERDIRNAIQSALEATGAFDGVFLWGFRDAAEQGAELTRAVAILPIDGAEDDRYDGVLDGQMFITAHVKLTIMARDESPQSRDEEADRLLDVVLDTLNGVGLNTALGQPVIYPQWTKVLRWAWKEPAPPQREIEAIFQYVFDAPTWTGFDTSE